MKKIFSFLAFTMVLFASCEKYEDYDFEKYDYSAVYFPYNKLTRTAVSDEGLAIKVGVYIGGLRNNSARQEFTYELVPVKDYKTLPEDYYTLGSDVIVAEKGNLQGFVDLTFDQEKFSNDPLCLSDEYALSFKITGKAGMDSIWETHQTTTIAVQYINTYAGDFYPIGVVKAFKAGTDSIQNIAAFGDEYDYTKFQTKVLTTLGVDSVLVGGIGDRTGKTDLMQLNINSDNSVDIVAVSGASHQVMPNGTSTWDPLTRRFNLKYKYTEGDMEYRVDEALIFRNRIRDGINEWHWSGFDGN